MDENFDYIITGLGCAGLSLVMRMIKSGKFSEKKILLVDRDLKNRNDRTWCFWEKKEGFFQDIVFKSWDRLWFHSKDSSILHDTAPYTYKLIKGIDFYHFCLNEIAAQKNISFLQGNVEHIESTNEGTFVTVNGEKIKGTYIFNSILFHKPLKSKKNFFLLQHFKGWIIESEKEVFNSKEATLMDFRVGQQNGTSFVYIMPFSSTRALVEYTVFSEKVLQDAVYDLELRNYLDRIHPFSKYKILEEELGSIPMTNYIFPKREKNIVHIGTSGGNTKGSSGYTFQFIQKQSDALVAALLDTGKPFIKSPNKRFHFYDSVLLNVLATKKMNGDQIFQKMFSKNKCDAIFPFLDDESSFRQELGIIRSFPMPPFLKAAFEQLF